MAHSDGDVVVHAVIDGCLGALALGDIGSHFPADDDRWQDAAGCDLLADTLGQLAGLGWAPAQIDVNIIAERPRLEGHKPAIRQSMSKLLSLDADRVSIKARSHEKVDAVGRGEAIACQALVVLTVDRFPSCRRAPVCLCCWAWPLCDAVSDCVKLRDWRKE